MEELFDSYKAFTKINKEIKDKNINKALNRIASYTKHIITLDIEFYTYMSLNLKYHANYERLDQEKIRTVSFPKEIAGIWFYKGEKYWNIKGSFHFNVVPPHLINSLMKFKRMRMTHVKYSTVSSDTEKHMKNLERKIFNDDEFMLRYVNARELKFKKKEQLLKASHKLFIYNTGKYKPILKKIFSVYINDNMVKKRSISKDSLYKILSAIMGKKNTIITKEDSDIKVMENYLQLIIDSNRRKYTRVEKEINHFDIKIFNGYFKDKYGSAKLEDEFNSVKSMTIFKKNLAKFYKDELKKLITTAHDPLTDSIWALVVAMAMILKCN